MKKNTLYTILLVLIIGLFTSNFIIFKMKNEVLTISTTLTIIVSSILILKDNFLRKKTS